MNRAIRVSLVAGALAAAAVAVVVPQFLTASDHDDGEVELKGRHLNLTDLYVFREVDQNPARSAEDLIFIMNVNPRSLARQQYYFSTIAAYEFKVSRVADDDVPPTGEADVVLRFKFGAPDAARRQGITLTVDKDGARVVRRAGHTTPLDEPPSVTDVHVGGHPISVFAGLREDPFFFDVEAYFRVRAFLRGEGPPPPWFNVSGPFRNPGLDFAAGYNVLSIVARVPKALLRGPTSVNTFDGWQTISVPGVGSIPGAATMDQVERLAQPAINEGLLVTNDFLNTLNRIGPDDEAAALAGKPPQAQLLDPILAEAAQTIEALPNHLPVPVVVGAFLPDVMRIDTTGASGYGAAVNSSGRPIRGRKILDDVIDITLTVLTQGAVTTDNVSYFGPNLGGSGHRPPLSDFPYLADPN